MRKFLFLCIISLMFSLVGCVILQDLFVNQPLEIYAFSWNEKDFSVSLPKEVPMPSETAIQDFNWYSPSPLVALFLQYKSEQFFPCITFWFTDKIGVFMLVFHPNAEEKIPYMYIKGIPILIDAKKAKEIWDGIYGSGILKKESTYLISKV